MNNTRVYCNRLRKLVKFGSQLYWQEFHHVADPGSVGFSWQVGVLSAVDANSSVLSGSLDIVYLPHFCLVRLPYFYIYNYLTTPWLRDCRA